MFLSYFEWNEAKEGSVFYILYQYIHPTSDLPQARSFITNQLNIAFQLQGFFWLRSRVRLGLGTLY